MTQITNSTLKEMKMRIDMRLFKQKKYYIAVDFDGTLVENKYPQIGMANPFIVKSVLKLKEYYGGCICFILWTCRSGEDLNNAVDFCKKCNLPFDYYNENPEFGEGRKIYADEYWDDKAVKVFDIDISPFDI